MSSVVSDTIAPKKPSLVGVIVGAAILVASLVIGLALLMSAGLSAGGSSFANAQTINADGQTYQITLPAQTEEAFWVNPVGVTVMCAAQDSAGNAMPLTQYTGTTVNVSGYGPALTFTTTNAGTYTVGCQTDATGMTYKVSPPLAVNTGTVGKALAGILLMALGGLIGLITLILSLVRRSKASKANLAVQPPAWPSAPDLPSAPAMPAAPEVPAMPRVPTALDAPSMPAVPDHLHVPTVQPPATNLAAPAAPAAAPIIDELRSAEHRIADRAEQIVDHVKAPGQTLPTMPTVPTVQPPATNLAAPAAPSAAPIIDELRSAEHRIADRAEQIVDHVKLPGQAVPPVPPQVPPQPIG